MQTSGVPEHSLDPATFDAEAWSTMLGCGVHDVPNRPLLGEIGAFTHPACIGMLVHPWRLQCFTPSCVSFRTARTTLRFQCRMAHDEALPKTYRKLIGRKVGRSFREVAEVEECNLDLPPAGQVRC